MDFIGGAGAEACAPSFLAGGAYCDGFASSGDDTKASSKRSNAPSTGPSSPSILHARRTFVPPRGSAGDLLGRRGGVGGSASVGVYRTSVSALETSLARGDAAARLSARLARPETEAGRVSLRASGVGGS